MSLTFFSEGGSNRPPRIPKFFFREGVQGVQGVNRGLIGFWGGGGPLGGCFRGSRGSVHGIFLFSFLYLTRKYPIPGYILGVLTHTTAWDRHCMKVRFAHFSSGVYVLVQSGLKI